MIVLYVPLVIILVPVMSTKRSIAFLCHPYHRGGVTRWMADAAIAAAVAGHEVYFLTVEPVSEFFSGKGRETMLQLLGSRKGLVKIIKCSVGYEFEFGTDEYRSYIYKQLVVQLPLFTPVILSDSEPTWIAATAFYGTYPIVGVLHADEDYYYSLAEKYYKRVDIFACVSKRVSTITSKRIPEFNSDQIYTIPCGIEFSSLQRGGDDNAILKLVYVGRISDYQKRTGDLLKMVSLLAKDNTSFHLDIIGDGVAARAVLEQRFKDEGLSKYVTFRGWLSKQEVAIYLSQSDILLLTSDFEGTPIAMMEALAAGCGVVGTRVSGIEDYEHHQLATGCYSVFAVGDIADAVQKINKIATIPEQTRVTAARALAESEFTMQVCMQKYFAAIDEIQMKPISPVKVKLSLFDRLYSGLIAFARYQKMKFSQK